MQGFIDQGIRLPTSADADPEEQVLWSWFDGETDRIIKAHYNQVECGPRWAALNTSRPYTMPAVLLVLPWVGKPLWRR